MEHYFFPMLAFGLIALLGLLLAAMDYWHGRGIETRLQMRLAALVVLAALTLAAGLMRYILFQDYTATEAGRYWLALWPGLGMLIMIGLWTIFSGERTGRYWVPLVVLALLGADIASVWWTGVFYQQWPWPGM
jgi:drug/metabolite transporter (DMT)-like permease